MAYVKLSEQWNGIPRTSGNYTVETCYGVYYDPDDVSAPSYLCVNGLCIYTDTLEDINGLLPATVSVRGSNEKYVSFASGDTIRFNEHSPSGVLMRYAVVMTSSGRLEIPDTGGGFTLYVTVDTADGNSFSFQEACYCPIRNTVTPPSYMISGRVYDFTMGSAIPAGNLFQSRAQLRFSPTMNGIPVVDILDNGYVDPYTQVSDATSSFDTIQFAIANPGFLIDTGSDSVNGNADVTIKTWYQSADFTGGVLILDLSAQVQLTVGPGVDENLRPALTDAMITLNGTDGYNVGHTAYVHRKSTLTLTPEPQFRYGDSLYYIQHNGARTFSGSIRLAAEGTKPGTEYVNPDTGNTETAGEETIGSAALSVCGKKWGLMSANAVKTYPVLWYATPSITEFAVHRAVYSASATDYQYKGSYYQKDDFGTYCIVEYSVAFSPLGGLNKREATLVHGVIPETIDITTAQSGFLVFQAGDSSMDVSLELTDDFFPYGITATIRLSTSGILLDYLAGGKGMAVGKKATEPRALDIASDWKLLFYQADVGAYNSDTSSKDLVSWMHGIDDRLTALEKTT